MKKKFLLFFTALLLILGFAGMHNQKVSAAGWGAKTLYTTSKATRGTWYYKDGHHIIKTTITAHSVDGVKAYKILRGKARNKWTNKLDKRDERSDFKFSKKISESMLEAYNFNYRGVTSFHANGWLAAGGNGTYYTPIKRTIKGKKVNALRLGVGYKNKFLAYAYKNRKLAK